MEVLGPLQFSNKLVVVMGNRVGYKKNPLPLQFRTIHLLLKMDGCGVLGS